MRHELISVEPDPLEGHAFIATVEFTEEPPWWVSVLRRVGIQVEFTPSTFRRQYSGRNTLWKRTDTGEMANTALSIWMYEQVWVMNRKRSEARGT